MNDHIILIKKFNIISFYEIVFVCGLYKSGTSLITSLIEDSFKYYNPANLTNPLERGYGRENKRYYTKECKLLRQINQEFLKNNKVNYRSLRNYIELWKKPLVLKDPLFILNLHEWISMCRFYHYTALTVFTYSPYSGKKLN